MRGIQKRMAGKDALSSKKSLGKLSEKKSQSKAMDTLEAKRKAQAKGYFKKTVYDTAEKVKAAAIAEKTIGGKVLVSKGGSGLLMSVAPIILPVLIMAMLVIILFLGILGGIAGDDAQKKASLDGMPSWVTYDLVLSCLKAHEEYGYPPSALLGQMMIENGTSDEGSDLGRLYHNYEILRNNRRAYHWLREHANDRVHKRQTCSDVLQLRGVRLGCRLYEVSLRIPL